VSVAPHALVVRQGRQPAGELGLDLTRAGSRARWLLLACLLAASRQEAHALRAWLALVDAGLGDPAALAGAGEAVLVPHLAEVRPRDAQRLAARLTRLARALVALPGGSLEPLAAESLDLSELGGRLVRLAPGLGTASVARFLRPLRDAWPAAREIPLAATARAAALHLGWIAEGEDLEGEPVLLRTRLGAEAPAFADVEAALERLGAAACLRERTRRCPLDVDCPRRG
jgi:hypothetical protein